METVKRIKELIENYNEIYTLFDSSIKTWKLNPRHFDKTGYGFNLNSSFRACRGIEISFDSWVGTNGDSSCYRACDLNADIFNRHLVSYMNKHKEEIMLEIAGAIKNEAHQLKDGAEQELNKQLKLISEL